MEIPRKDICAQVYFPQEIFLKHYHRGKLGSPQISAHKDDSLVLAAVFVCVTKNAQTNCQCVSNQFIGSKTQEKHSRGNTANLCLTVYIPLGPLIH